MLILVTILFGPVIAALAQPILGHHGTRAE
ncbi:hypothetical protein SAMN05443377_11325 [Propionibacterium cyclohexanicum]|uniref:Uncharacterized protein n=1 Tax=Propionibacterium cyclohexanicum TaxID=64702 RepID=A0A1H9SGT0_9ACTN|nr:hypothetical protein SAMN05443377_11325 [Propionibacterium cyclohexanicum]